MRRVAADLDVVICAVDRGNLRYPSEVAVTIAADDPGDYRRAARSLVEQGVDVVLIQHEYGIFGGAEGRYVLGLADELGRLGVPYLVTLHTVLAQPSRAQAEVLAELCRDAAGVTVFTPTAVRLAVENRLLSHRRVAVVPHGVPDVIVRGRPPAPVSRTVADVLAACEDRRMLSTFGLLTPAKGIDTALSALATLVQRHPSIHYVVAGQTHPDELGPAAEPYSDTLRSQAEALGLTDHVTFVDEFLDLSDLAALLARTEVYLTPYRSRDQISSGTLTFAVAAGCAVVSTDYHYAKDLLKPGMGVLVPPGDVEALARAVDGFLSDEQALAVAQATNRLVGRRLAWPEVARAVADLARDAASGRREARVHTGVVSPVSHARA